jgi:AraC-like DNA-binding protein
MAYNEMSDTALRFVQRCQVAVGVCAEDDYAAQVSALWYCLDTFPRDSPAVRDLTAACAAVYRIAVGFFGSLTGTRSSLGGNAQRVGRRHVNALLQAMIMQHGDPALTLGQLAASLDLSRSHLSRTLAAETGHSFPTHLNGVRLLSAIMKLRDPVDRVKSIAAGAGYSGTGELDRQFQRRFGVTPKQFRGLLEPCAGVVGQRVEG